MQVTLEMMLIPIILIATLLPFAVYLTIRFIEKHAALRNQLGELQKLWYEVSLLNSKLVSLAQDRGITLTIASADPPYEELGD